MPTIDQEIAQLSRQIEARAVGGPAKAVADVGSVMLSLNRIVDAKDNDAKKLQSAVTASAITANINAKNRREALQERRDYEKAEKLDSRQYNESQYVQKYNQRRADEESDLKERRDFAETNYEKRRDETRAHIKSVEATRLKEKREYDILEKTKDRKYLKMQSLKKEEDTATGELVKSFTTRIDEVNTVEELQNLDLELQELEAQFSDVLDEDGNILIPGNKTLQTYAMIEEKKISDKLGFLNRQSASVTDLNTLIRELDDERKGEFKSGDYIFSSVHEDDLNKKIYKLQDAFTEAERLNYVNTSGQMDERIAKVAEYVNIRSVLQRLDDDVDTKEFDIPDLSAIILPEDDWLTIGGKKVRSSAADALQESLRLLSAGDIHKASELLHVSDQARRRSLDRKSAEIRSATTQARILQRKEAEDKLKSTNNQTNILISGMTNTGNALSLWAKDAEKDWLTKSHVTDIPDKVNLSVNEYTQLKDQAAKSILSTISIPIQPGDHGTFPAFDLVTQTRDVDNAIRAWAENGSSAVEASELIKAITGRKDKYELFGEEYDFSEAMSWPELFLKMDFKGSDASRASTLQRNHLTSSWALYDHIDTVGMIDASMGEVIKSFGNSDSKIVLSDEDLVKGDALMDSLLINP